MSRISAEMRDRVLGIGFKPYPKDITPRIVRVKKSAGPPITIG
jgi:hypothetical protein